MPFEHYLRKGTKVLRCGYTTGTCAALAASAATRLLLCGTCPETVSLISGSGIPVEVEVSNYGIVPPHETENGEEAAWASVIKDAGDDPDVTDGLMVRADVSRIGDEKSSRTVSIDGGRGVGRVTRPGLDQPVGNAAINSGPRRMIRDAVRSVCDDLGYEGGIRVVISVPDGEAAADKTFNPQLGIEGGISILGTTGIVEPMSEQALVDTIEIEMKQIAAADEAENGARRLIITPGNYGMDFINEQGIDKLGVPILKFSNFLGETLDMITGMEFDEVLLVAHAGKLVKAAAGIMNTHSRYADGRNEIFCAHAAICGGSTELCRELMKAATTDACIEILDGACTDIGGACSQINGAHRDESGACPDIQGNNICSDANTPEGQQLSGCRSFRECVIESIMDAVQDKLERRTGKKYRIGALMFSNVYGQLGLTAEGAAILEEWRKK